MTPEQRDVLDMKERQGMTRKQIASELGISETAVKRRLERARTARVSSDTRRESLDPHVVDYLKRAGYSDLSGVHSGWVPTPAENEGGKEGNVYFYLGKDEQYIKDLGEAISDALVDHKPLKKIKRPKVTGEGYCNFVPLADLHLGGEYGNPEYEAVVTEVIDDVVSRLPPAEKAVLVELGDLFDANDHLGVTPASKNNCDVIRENHLATTQLAVKIMKRAIYRLAQTHREVEVHMCRGNHDETAYISVMVALAEHFERSDHVTIVVSDADYRVIPWGECAVFPNHGDKIKWGALKDVWADQFPDEWAAAKMQRLIWTAHFHHRRAEEMIGAEGEHFRTTAAPNKWAQQKGMISRGGMVGVTLHKEWGETGRTVSMMRPRRVV